MKKTIKQKNDFLVTCIIPAYNEATRIGLVLRSIERHPRIGQLIVVNDGSTDGTAAEARQCRRAHLIDLSRNKGKTHAVMQGIAAARYKTIMLLDADLIGLTHADIDQLIDPVRTGTVDVTISMRKNTLRMYRMLSIDFISGERVFPKDLLSNKQAIRKLPGYGLEVFLNDCIIERSLRLRVVRLDHVEAARKKVKVGAVRGFLLEVGMVIQIIGTIGITHLIYQLWKLRELSRATTTAREGAVTRV